VRGGWASPDLDDVMPAANVGGGARSSRDECHTKKSPAGKSRRGLVFAESDYRDDVVTTGAGPNTSSTVNVRTGPSFNARTPASIFDLSPTSTITMRLGSMY